MLNLYNGEKGLKQQEVTSKIYVTRNATENILN